MTVATIAQPRTRRWTRDEYYRLSQQGWFSGQRVQLIEGEIIQMPPQGHAHTRSYLAALEVLSGIFGSEYVRPQAPLNVPGESDPEPDLAVTDRPYRQYTEHPKSAVMVIEIADSSISLERRKAGLYARAGVPDYWIVNIEKRRLEVFRSPLADADQEFGYRYGEQFEVAENGTIAPLASPKSQIQVKSLF